MKEELYDDTFEEKEEQTDIKAILFKYIIRWPWFVASIIICITCAWLYLKQSTPVYNITASVIIKDKEKGGTTENEFSGLEELGLLNSSKNIDNEIEILRSKSLIKDVVNELGLYIKYSTSKGFKNIELYKTSPILIHYSSKDAEVLDAPMQLSINYQKSGQIYVNLITDKGNDSEKNISKNYAKLPAVLSSEKGTITFMSNPQVPITEDGDLEITILPSLSAAKGYHSVLLIEPTSKTTSVATISIKNTNKKRGEDFINKLVEMYNRDANNDKNEISQNTARFIDERISVINQELGSTEQELENFKRKSGLTDLSSDAQLAIAEKSGYEKLCVENGTQLNLIKYLSDYLNKPENANTTLPVNVGLDDEALTSLISQYNALILERNRLRRASSDSNPVVRRLDSNIDDMHASLLTTINSVYKGLLITKADLDRQAGKYAGQISNAPAQERRFVSIQRQQEIKAGLYLMLLQKREENNIALAATANNAKIIDDALADDIPISPNKKIIYLAALVLGFGIPVAVIYILSLLSYRIEGHSDVERLTRVPVIGDVPLNDSNEKYTIAVRENDNDIMAETFRSLRTNLLFMLGDPDKKVILVTSTTSGEGKTFIASNLAVSLALLGKKVVIVGLDIRKPGLNKVFHISHKERGITQYLVAPQSTDLRSMIQSSDLSANLNILPGGTIPPNPTELLARKSLDDAIELLKKDYDYVVLDTAPIGMVTDTQLIARVADISVYVCRADYTHKNDYQLINELYANKRLPGLCTVINGLDMKKKKYGYYYGYGKYGRYYGYGKKYGYGYGYGDTSDSK
ncbi:polysaccharide biosynthesis tyrosine autokinase [Bacteroides stercoris]|jgi:capsular exopolysaccharide family|uniref:GumC family protein n=1 Tax=Bacteroides stercoris TaxID=46506 RepID=UPI001C2D2475|nr:polysaccharide biosynthesis tyrosine autokinase [Bacteroides stercoris]MBV1681513.1 polysaccharide biosynthesis tyrosine autokinase [Bacteroides stercoris]